MNGIVGMTDLALETDLSEDQRHYLDMVRSSVDRLLVVVGDVLDFSKIENGELELEPSDFNLKESLDHELYVMSQTAVRKGLKLTCDIAPDVPENLFGDHLVNDLIPWVDAHYRTLVDREYRAIGGLSRGGNWAVRIGIMNWDLFEAIGAHSAPLFYGDLDRIPGWIEAIPESKIPRLYLDIGGDDTDWEDAAAFESLLVELSVPHSWHQFPGMHEESYWHAHLDEYLLWYSSGWGAE